MIPNQWWAIQIWKERVYDKQSEVDPGNEEVWKSIALGFAFGLGYQPNEAHKFVRALDNEKLL